MNKILLKDYNEKMGIFIDLNDEPIQKSFYSLNVSYERLLIKHQELLKKNNKYFIYCRGGVRSKKAVSILSFYGYDVTMVVNE